MSNQKRKLVCRYFAKIPSLSSLSTKKLGVMPIVGIRRLSLFGLDVNHYYKSRMTCQSGRVSETKKQKILLHTICVNNYLMMKKTMMVIQHPFSIHVRSFLFLCMLWILLSSSTTTTCHAERAYPQGCSNQPPSYYDYYSKNATNNIFPPPDLALKSVNDYFILQRLGTGKFSDVFEAVDASCTTSTTTTSSSTNTVDPQSIVVLKCLKPVSERKVRREIMILQHASKLPNLARILALVLPNTSSSRSSSSSNTHNDATAVTGAVPTLVLQHAGPDCRWLSHYGGGSSNRATVTTTCNTLGGKPSSSSATATPKVQTANNPSRNDDDDEEEEDTTLSDYEIRYYLFHLLIALDCLHQKGIMHRDVKPRNCLIRRLGHTSTSTDTKNNPNLFSTLSTSLLGGSPVDTHIKNGSNNSNNKSTNNRPISQIATRGSPLMLIDLGLADFYLPNQRYNVRVASRHYKGPELLVGYEYYDYALDLWGVGCILASLLCFREPFFRGKDNLDQLGKIIMQLGTTDLLSYILKYQIQVDPDVQKLIQSYHATGQYLNRKPWILDTSSSVKGNSRRTPDPKGLDLLDKLLVYDHEQRWTARQAMDHPFFDVVRRRVLTEVRSYAGPDVVLPSLSSPSPSSSSNRNSNNR